MKYEVTFRADVTAILTEKEFNKIPVGEDGELQIDAIPQKKLQILDPRRIKVFEHEEE